MLRLGGDQITASHKFVALDVGVVMNGPPVAAEGAGLIEGEPIKVRHSLWRVFHGQAIPAFLVHPTPIFFIVHNGNQDPVIGMNDQRYSPQDGE
jgi:hypothetical protein